MAYQPEIENSPKRRRSFLPGPKTFGTSSNSTAVANPKQGKATHHSTKPTEEEVLYVGQRVLIGGIKLGTVLYYGRTHIADGLWCGIELDDPDGRHDGQVEGVRYFRCRNGHGIFAPLEKVTKADFPGVAVKENTEEDQLQQQCAVAQQRLQRRLLPQPKSFVRTGSRERILIPSKIEEQNEDIIDGEEEIFKEEKLTQKIGSRANKEKKFGDTFTKEELTELLNSPKSSPRESPKPSPKRSKLPTAGTSKLPQSLLRSEVEAVRKSKEREYSPQRTHQDSFDSTDLNSTYLIKSSHCNHEEQGKGEIRNLNETYFVGDNHTPKEAVSGDDSLSTDVQECLSSDNRQYLNFTFDTESKSNEGSPQHKVNESTAPEDITSSSLGILDLEKSGFDTDVLDGAHNLTDSEKLIKGSSNKQVKTIGSVSEFSGDAVHSTPKDFPAKQGEVSVLPKEVVNSKPSLDYTQPVVKKIYDSAFEIKDEVAGVTDDILDWRQEASDGENSECNENLQEERSLTGEIGLLPTEIVIENGKNRTFTKQNVDDDLIVQENILTKSTGSDVEQLFQKIKKPMTDSGVSDLGDILHLEQGRMADSCELRRSQNLESVEELIEQEIASGQASSQLLMADLAKGHSRQSRPLSLISTTSADTGYVPDTDSEIETSPMSWAEKEGLPENTSKSDLDQAYAKSFRNFQAAVEKGTRRALDPDSDSDVYSDAGTIIADTDTLRASNGLLDLDNMSDMLMDIDGLEPSELLPLPLEEEACKVEGPTMDQIKTPTNPDEEEDDRIEADQQEYSGEAETGSGAVEAKGHKSDLPSGDHDVKNTDSSTTDTSSAVVDGVSVCSEGEKSNDAPPESSQNVSLSNSSQNEEKKVPENVDKANVEKTGKIKGNNNNKGKSPRKKKEVEKVEHKKPNINVGSRLADYIKAPLPVKVKEEKEESPKPKQNVKKNVSKVNEEKESKSTQNESDTVNEEKNKKKVEKEIPKIKREKPKSKWENIMSQIEENQTKPKAPKKEVKSMLQQILSTPAPTNPKKEKEPKPKKTLPSAPKVDYSKVKSKLNIAPSTPPVKRSQSPAVSKRQLSPFPNKSDKPRRHSSVVSNAGGAAPKLDLNESCGSSILGSGISSVRSSRSDLNVESEKTEGDTNSPRAAKPTNPKVTMVQRERRDSTSSTVSDVSQGSVKAMNAKNLKITESADQRRKSLPVKSSIPPPINSPKPQSPARSTSGTRTPLKTNTSETNKPTTKKSSTPSTSSSKPVKSPTKPNTSTKQKSPSGQKSNNQNRNKTSKKEKHSAKTQQKEAADTPPAISPQAKQEIARLEALCETRTKELNFSKLQMKSNLLAFDAMAALVNYLSHDLDAFSCPSLAQKLGKLQSEMSESQAKIVDLQENKSHLEQELTETKEHHMKQCTDMKEEHNKTIAQQKDNLDKDKEQAVKKTEDFYSDEIRRLKNYQEKQIRELKHERQEDIKSLQKKQDEQMEELHKQHRDKLEDITHRFESMKMNLSEKVNTLRYECEDLKVRAKISEDALLKDSDQKVQLALAPFRHLPQEIESLKLVIEMRNDEIQKLRSRNNHLEKQLDELQTAKEKIIGLQQKLENTEAICTLKTDHEKQLHEKCQVLMRKFDRESKANKRLSMDYEELMWKLNQTSELGSQENLWRTGGVSPTPSDSGSPSVRRKAHSPSIMEGEKLTPRSPGYRRSLSNNAPPESPVDKRLKRRSATFLLEDRTRSPTGSPLHKRPHGSDSSSSSPSHQMSRSSYVPQSSYADGELSNGKTDRMVHSLNDMEVFDGPHALPSPPLLTSGSSSVSLSTSSGGSDPVSPEHIMNKSSVNKNKDIISSSERSEGDGCADPKLDSTKSSPDLPYADKDSDSFSPQEETVVIEDLKDDNSEMSQSTESNVLSNTSSLCWDYEKMDSVKSMDSSQASDSLLEQNDAWQTDTMTKSVEMSSSSSTETVTLRKASADQGLATQENIPQAESSSKSFKVSSV